MDKLKGEALVLAKKSILERFGKSDLSEYIPDNNELNIEGICFVTLETMKKKLKGCIGSIVPERKLYEDIIVNAKSRAFEDPKFTPLLEEELNNLNLKISILSPLKNISFENIGDLLKYLKKHKPGLLIKFGSKQSIFLSSVWEKFYNENDFLIHLINKAGILVNDFILNFEDFEFLEFNSYEFGEEFSKI